VRIHVKVHGAAKRGVHDVVGDAVEVDVAVLVVRMPGMSAAEVTRAIRATRGLRTRVVLVGALGLDEQARTGLAAGAES
jgi:CheY-like chemotaxis protein